MLRFGSESPPPERQPVLGGRVVHLLVLLIASISLIAYFAGRGGQPDQPKEVQDKSGTSYVHDTSSTPSDESNQVHAVELSRIAGFRDHLRTIDYDAYYYLLDLASRNPAQWMEEQARRDVSWAHLLRDPDDYRGQLIFLNGRLRRLVADEIDHEAYDLKKRYEGWLYTDEGGKYPYAVIVSEPPTGMPLGLINEPVQVAGYFLGWYRYNTLEGNAHAAPIIIGRRFRPVTTPPLRPDVAWQANYGLAIGIVIVVACLGVIYVNFRRLRPKMIADSEAPVFEPVTEPRANESSHAADHTAPGTNGDSRHLQRK